jgi:integrase
MASIEKRSTKAGTNYMIRLSDTEHPERPRVNLGRINRRQAETVKAHVEQLMSCRRTGTIIPPASQTWLAGLPDAIRDRLEALEIALPRVNAKRYTVTAWIDEYLTQRTDIKPRTRENMNQARAFLVDFAGELQLADFTAGHADEVRRALLAKGLAESTVRRRTKRMKQFFTAAIKRRLITENPFADIPTANVANTARQAYIDRETITAVIDACPDASWRLVFALARYGGLRMPSEIQRMTWEDIDWLNARFKVHSCKTEHIPGKASRIVPLFPELEPFFQAALDEAKTGEDLIFPRLAKRSNLRTQAHRIIRRAGFEPWERVFSNLRASRQTELVEEFPLHVVTDWIGNSPDVARLHYLQTHDEHFQRAVRPRTNQRDPAPGVNRWTAGGQRAHETSGNEAQREKRGNEKAPENKGETPELAGIGASGKIKMAPPRRLELLLPE